MNEIKLMINIFKNLLVHSQKKNVILIYKTDFFTFIFVSFQCQFYFKL